MYKGNLTMKFCNSVSAITTLVFIMSLSLGLTSCGSGDNSASQKIETGVFIDGLVEGLTYKTTSRSGLTDENGGFAYIEGEEIVFSIGDITLGSAIAKPIMTPLEILGDGKDQSSSVFINIIRLLQTLDYDSNPQNGIQIPEQAHMFASDITLPLDVAVEQFENDQTVLSYIQNVTGKSSLISLADAVAHWEDTYYGSLFFHAVTDNQTMPVLLMAYDGSRIVSVYDDIGQHTGAIITLSDGDELVLELNSNGTPKSITDGETYISFSNYTEKNVDIGIVYKDGSIDTFSELMNTYSYNAQSEIKNQFTQIYQAKLNNNLTVPDIADAVYSAHIVDAVKNQITMLVDDVALLSDAQIETKLVKTVKSAVIKELIKNVGSKLLHTSVDNIDAAITVSEILVASSKCAISGGANTEACVSYIVDSAKVTYDAAKILVETYVQNGVIVEMAADLADKKLLSAPTIQATANIIGLIPKYYGQGMNYKVELVKSGHSNIFDNTPVDIFQIKLDGEEKYGAYSDISAGYHKFVITGTDQFGVSNTIVVELTIPDRPVVPESDKLEVTFPSLEASSQLTKTSKDPVSFRIVTPPKNAMPSSLNLNSETGEYTYSAIPNSGASDSFTYVAEHLLTIGCISSESFNCMVPSKEGRVEVTLKTVLTHNYSITETIQSYTTTGEGGGVGCANPSLVGTSDTYTEQWAFHYGDCKNGKCLFELSSGGGGFSGYFFNPVTNSLNIIEEKSKQVDFTGEDGYTRYYEFTGTITGQLNLESGIVTGTNVAKEFRAWTGDNTTQTCTRTSTLVATP